MPAGAPQMTAAELAIARARARAFVDAKRSTMPQKPPARLMDFIPASSKRMRAPEHLAPLVELFERARREQVLAVVSAPPRHGKTVVETHAIPWTLAHDPGRQVAFASYAAKFAEKQSRASRDLAVRWKVPLAADARARGNWRTGVDDGGCWATSIGGQITGEGFHLIIVDDPVKDRKTAESPTQRDDHYEWLNDVVFTRLEPGGSCIVTQTRWHEDDLAGRLIRDGWEHVNLPALNADGEPLCPWRFTAEQLLRIKTQIGEYAWSSLYMGQPVPRGGKVFRDVHYYKEEALPASYRVAIGGDFAYSEKTRADYSVYVVLAEADGVFYVLDFWRGHVESPEFARVLMGADDAPGPIPWYGLPLYAYLGGTELGVAQHFRELGVPVVVMPTSDGSKFVRAQSCAAAWNAGRMLLPEGAPWLEEFIAEICGFTGVKDKHDDIVDALVSAFNSMTGGALPEVGVTVIG